MRLISKIASVASFGVAYVFLGEYYKNEIALARYRLGFIDKLKLTYDQISEGELKEIMEISNEFSPEIDLTIFDSENLSNEILAEFAKDLSHNPNFKIYFSKLIGLDMAFMEPERKEIFQAIRDVAAHNEIYEDVSFASKFCDGYSEFLAGETLLICEEI